MKRKCHHVRLVYAGIQKTWGKMKIIKAKLLKDLTHYQGCSLKEGDEVIVKLFSDGQAWVRVPTEYITKRNLKGMRIRIFRHEYEQIT